MSELITEPVEKLTAAEKKTAEIQVAKKKAKIVDDKSAEFQTRSEYQAQYSACESIIPESQTFGMDENRRHEIRARIKRDQQEERQPVKGIFRYFETPGGELRFPYRAYKGDPLQMFKLKDGQVATVPLGVARHLRHRLEYPVHGWRVNENNLATHTAANKMVKRCTFEYIEFFDPRDEELRQQQKSYTTEQPVRLVI